MESKRPTTPLNLDEFEGDDVFGLLFPTSSCDNSLRGRSRRDYYSRTNFSDIRHAGQPEQLTVSLVEKHHSLWGEFVYNAARVLADRLDAGEIYVKDKRVLELGAGAGLPGLVAALNGASHSLITDYEDEDLIRVIDLNIDSISPYTRTCKTVGAGFTFGDNSEILTRIVGGHKFDVVLCADLIFNRSEHEKLLASIRDSLVPVTGECYVSFSHHDPKKSNLDLNFFELAQSEFDFCITKVGEEERPSYPFRMNDGLDESRGVINLYLLKLMPKA
jgi:nicotinamide N-methyltransferase